MKKTLNQMIILALCFTLLFPNLAVIAAEMPIVRYPQYAAEQKSKATGNIEVQISLRLPDNNPDFTVTVSSSSLKNYQPEAKTSEDKTVLYYSFKALPEDEYTLKISGKGYLDYTQEINLGNENVEIRLTNGHDGDNVVSNPDAPKVGVIGLGDIDGNKKINSDDEKAMVDMIDSGKYDSRYDLNKDSKVNIIDLSYITLNKDKSNVEATTLRSLNPDVITVEEPTEAKVASGDINNILKNNDEFVTLAPKSSGDISGDNPVEITLDLSSNEHASGAIVIAPSSNPENNIKAGTVSVDYEHNGKTETREFQINEPTLYSKRTVLLASNAGIMPVNLVLAKIDKDGSIVIDLEGQIAVKKVTIKVTQTGGNKLADISKVEFLNSMEDRIPAPDLDIPENLSATAGSKEFTLTWDKSKNITGYEVSVSSNGNTEILKVDANTITVKNFQNKEIKNGTKFEVKVQSVNGEWKSGYCKPITVIPKANSKPPKPENLKVISGYRYLTASWKMMDDTDSYDVYYKKASEDDSQYKLAVKNLVASTYTIRDLEDNTEYIVKVIGRNDLGTGDYAWSKATTADVLNHPELPKRNLINTENGKNITNHVKAAWFGTNSEGRQMVNSLLDKDEKLAGNTDFGTRYSALGLVDNDFSSYFTMNSWYCGTHQGDKNKALTFEFDAPQTISYITFADYQYVGSYERADIYYKKDGKWEILSNVRISEKTDKDNKKYQLIKLVQPIETDCIAFGVAGWAGRSVITVSEVRFYGYDTIEEEVDNLFGDKLHITLREGIQLKDIEDVEEKLKTPDDATQELYPDKDALQKKINLAKDIFNNNVKRDTIKIDSTVSTKYDSNITFLGGLNAGQPLGVVAHKGEDIIIYVGNPLKEYGSATDLELVLTQYHGTSASWYQSLGNLKVGENVISIKGVSGFDDDNKFGEKAEKGGSLYINYNGSNRNDEYAVRIVGGHDIPVLDLTKVDKDETSRKAAIKTYIDELEEYVNSNKNGELHNSICKSDEEKDEEIKNSQFDEANCILGATEIVLDQMMYSVSAQKIYEGLTESDKVDQLYKSLVAMEDMVDLFYSHKGLYKTDSTSDISRYPTTRLNTRYQRMFYGAFMYAGGKHIGIEWDSVSGLSGGKPIQSDDGKYEDGQYFGWGIAHEIGHIINEGAYAVAEVTNNYFSVLAQAKETNESVRFEYKNVYDKVTSGVKGRSSNVFTQLGLYWQLHLAYDKGYNFKMYDTREEQLNNLIFARMDTYAREIASKVKCTAPGKSDNTLTYDGADIDNKLMRLACAGAKKNLLEFFERWGMEPDDETREYASQFTKEERPIYYINDEARLYQLEGNPEMDEGTEVIANFEGNPKETMSEVTIHLDLSKKDKENVDSMLGYEIVRSYMETDPEDINQAREVKRAVAFIPIDGESEVEYTDVINSINNRVFTYSVRAVDKYLNVTETVTLEPIKVSDDGSIDKTNWSIDTNMVSTEDEFDSLDGEHEGYTENVGSVEVKEDIHCEPAKIKAISKIADGKPATSYTGSVEGKGEIVISLGSTEQIAALKYDGEALGKVTIEVSTDTINWTKVNETEITGDSIIYFNLDDRTDGKLYFYDAAYVKIIIEDASDVTINEIDLLGETGDNIELEEIGILKTEYTYDDKNGYTIPEGSLVFYGTYKGNPAYNVVLLRDENDKIIDGEQIILAPEPEEGNDLGEIHSGKWIYWIEPGNYGVPTPATQISALSSYLSSESITAEDLDELFEGSTIVEEPSYDDIPKLEEEKPSYDVAPELEKNNTSYSAVEPGFEEDNASYSAVEPDFEEDDTNYSKFEPETFDDEDNLDENESYVDEVNEKQSIKESKISNLNTIISANTITIKSVRAELYRVNDAHSLEGERLVSDTKRVEIPSDLQNIELSK